MAGRGGGRGGRGGGGEVPFFPPDDPSNPLYLHPNDNPGSVLVTDLLNGHNYLTWSRSMQTALLTKNKLGFINGSVQRSADLNDPLAPFWDRCNGMVVSWLRNSTVPQIRSTLMFMESTSQIWTDLHDRFSQGNKARLYELKHQLFTLKQGAHDINTYYSNLRIIWDEFVDSQPKEWCSCGGCRCNSSREWRNHQQTDFTMHFLMGLNDSYSQLRSQFLSREPFPSFSTLFSLVLQEERQRDIGYTLPGSLPPLPMSESPSSLANAAQNRTRDKLCCTHCHKTNHTIDKCYQLHGFPPGFGRGRGRGFSQDANSHTGRSVHSVTQSRSDSLPTYPPPYPQPVSQSPNTPPPPLSNEQCQQLISFLQTQMHSQVLSPDSAPTHSSTGSSELPNFSGCFQGAADWDG